MENAALSGHDEFLPVALHGIPQQSGGAAYNVGQFQHGTLTLGMCQHFGLRMSGLQLENFGSGEALVNVARAIPKQHFASRYGVKVCPEVAVGTEDDFLVGGEAIDNLTGVGRSDYHIGVCLCQRGGIDVGDNRMVRMRLNKSSKGFARTAVGQGTAGGRVGNEDGLVGT